MLHPLGHAEFAGTPGSVATVRTWARHLLNGRIATAALDDVVLLLSEVVTNAVVHSDSGRTAGGSVTVCLGLGADMVHAEVIDDGSATSLPFVRAAGPDSDGGRGLLLVEAIATGWASTRTPRRAPPSGSICRQTTYSSTEPHEPRTASEPPASAPCAPFRTGASATANHPERPRTNRFSVEEPHGRPARKRLRSAPDTTRQEVRGGGWVFRAAYKNPRPARPPGRRPDAPEPPPTTAARSTHPPERELTRPPAPTRPDTRRNANEPPR
ncbi:ATP-binding protein [Streptosporangium vulgare]|uniref:ATP-binding protein n=1 Tax=Streptosporangium vulgare TaxID=46190 RepID=A0ABV5T756_9ACTN